MQTTCNQSVVRQHQFFHTGSTFTAFITHYNNIAGYDFSCNNCIVSFGVIIEAFCFAAEYTHFFRHASRTNDCAIGCQIAAQDLKTRQVIQRIVQRTQQITALSVNMFQQFTPCSACHSRNIQEQFAFQHFHNCQCAASMIQIIDCVRAAGDNTYDTTDFFCVFFEIFHADINAQFITHCQNMQQCVCRPSNCHIENDSVQQGFPCNQLRRTHILFYHFYHMHTCFTSFTDFQAIYCRNAGCARQY